MMRRWTHPWWLHLPGAAVLVGFVAYEATRIGAWPDRVPLQYGLGGVPTSWGSPWIAFALVVGLGALFLVLSATLDELWARQESRKRFNPLTLLDELVIGLLVGVQVPLLENAIRGETSARIPWTVALCAGGAVLIAVLLERARPFSATPVAAEGPRPDAFGREVAARIARGEQVVYWDVQNPRYVALLSLGVPAVMWIGAGLTFGTEPWAALVLALVGLLLLQFYGGQRTRVTRNEVTIRYGLAGIRVFRCSTNEIASVGLRRFAALREFGGYGIRLSGSTIGYFLAGSRGVELGRHGKRAVLIGSDQPLRLAAVVGAVSGIEPTDARTGMEDE